MQFGIFTVSDITTDPTTGTTPTEHERIDAVVKIAKHADELGLDVFALGEHHNPPFFSSSRSSLLRRPRRSPTSPRKQRASSCPPPRPSSRRTTR